MSGIAGALYPDVFQVSYLVSPMLDTLGHRGQQPRDIFTYRNLQVGVCGQLFASNEKKTVLCALDGGLCNKTQLIQELRNLGYDLEEGISDSALIIHAYDAWGTFFPHYLNGNFAIVLFDQAEEQFILVRDRVGVKPLYWYYSLNLFLFSSEIKSLLVTGAVPQALATDTISSYLYFGYIPQDMTPLKNVSKLLPGYMLTYHLRRGMRIESYWSLSACFQSTHKENSENVLAYLDELTSKAVQSRLPTDSTVGCLVSGGLGSAATAFYVKKISQNKEVEAFITGFSGYNDEDIAASREVARTLDLPYEAKVLNPADLINDLSSIVWYLDEPLADTNVVSTWYLAKMASQKTRVVFSGMGSDEFLAGHSRYTSAEQQLSFWPSLVQSGMQTLKPCLLPLLNKFWPSLSYRYVKQMRTDPWQFSYLSRYTVFDLELLGQAAPTLRGFFDPEVFLHKFHHLSRIPNPISALLYLDIKTRLPDWYAVQYERMCTAHGLIWQTPFLDRDLMEFSAGIPAASFLKEEQAASLLKEILKDVYSKKILKRPKRTRHNFLGEWGHLSPIIELFNRLSHGSLIEIGLINPDWLKDCLKKIHDSPYLFRQLWCILMLELWIQIFINRKIEAFPPTKSPLELIGGSYRL